jgi:nucleotide-binding universal stress UspA family protein
MKPENTRAPIGPEQVVVPATGGSERDIPVLPTPEAGIETGAERVEQTAEAAARASDAAATAVPVIDPAINPVTVAPTTQDDGTPLVAADEDVIEKEWVDKAKKIITETKDDPHQRTARVNDLQKDYLQKRYGKVLGASE